MNPVFNFDSNEPEFNTIYAHELNQYLKEGVDWSAAPFKGASIEDMQQFGADSFAAGWLAYRSQAVQLFKNALPFLHLYSAQAKTGYDTLHVNQSIKNITEFLEVNVPNPWKTPYGCPKPEALKKRQFPAGGVVGEMIKQAGREIMADIENKTAETLNGMPKEYRYVRADLWEQFQINEKAIAELGNAGKCNTQEYVSLTRRAQELAQKMSEYKKEVFEKEAADKMAKMVADAMKVTDSFVKAAKAIQVFNREAKEAEATRKKFEHMAPKNGGQNPHTGKKYITDEKGFLFVAGNGEVLWALHDGAKYCFCNWEGGAWIGWRVSEADVIEAGHTQLPIFLDHFIRSIHPTE